MEQEPRRERMHLPLQSALLCTLTLLVFSCIALGPLMGYRAFKMPSGSMKPTIGFGERCLVDGRAYRGQAVSRGDVVVLHLPPPEDRRFVKRVIAVGGDRVDLREGKVFVNGTPLEEPYLNAPESTLPYWQIPPHVAVPEGHLWVMGDNRRDSEDSRQWGPVPASSVEGRVTAITFSNDFDRIGRRVR